MIRRLNVIKSAYAKQSTLLYSSLTLRFLQCDHPYHLGCLEPPLDTVPDGEWFCPECESDPGAPIGVSVPKKSKSKGKGKSEEAPEPTPKAESGGKRKAPAKAKAGGKSASLCVVSIC